MTTKQKRALAEDNRQFAMTALAQFAVEGEGSSAKRRFSGIAYSGEVITEHWYWGNVVFDLSSITVPPKMPALIDHDRGLRAGFVTDSGLEPSGLRVRGQLLTNDSGQAVAKDSDDGFPWQMSVHITPGRVEEIMAGTKTTVNGKELMGPLTVFKDSVLKEVSFTATGWDSNTTATALSRPSGGILQPPSTGEMSMTEDEIKAMQADNARLKAESEASKAAATAANEAAAKFSKERRTADITTLFGVLGREFKADDPQVLAFAAMDQAGFDLTASMLREQATKTKPAANAATQALFSHQAQTGGQGSEQTAAPATNPLLPDAKKRAEQFAAGHKTGFQFARG